MILPIDLKYRVQAFRGTKGRVEGQQWDDQTAVEMIEEVSLAIDHESAIQAMNIELRHL